MLMIAEQIYILTLFQFLRPAHMFKP